MTKPERIHPACPTSAFPFQVGGKWTGMVVVTLAEGTLRFGDLRAALAPVTAKVLTETLREMHRDGLIARQDFGTNPPHVEYRLTELGHSLLAVIDSMRDWSRHHLADLLRNRETAEPDRRFGAAKGPSPFGDR